MLMVSWKLDTPRTIIGDTLRELLDGWNVSVVTVVLDVLDISGGSPRL